ncbi:MULTISPECIES: pyrophosphatase PpaX [Sporosarcina]|uniref:Pyrophosphatase PpaX n=1 Tax=Sporosarcina psychrophila TaxID=1476 RepID=A0ABV2KDG8_SPOPS|nr:pyrophosphatase PpaX [Sporosarcina sp. resist]QNK88893.1 pyrophosphatase PpaX [Sporosarcina sp. resist]
MAKPITTLLFDFDGTLLDTNELIIQTFQYVLGNHYPGKYERIDILPFLGPTLYESFDSVEPEKTEQLIEEYRAWNKSMHDELSIEFDGVSETMRLLKAAGMKMAIVSTKRKDMIMRGLELLDVEGVFDEVIAMDDVTKTKPDPEPILLALERLGANADEALMIGDNYHDIVGGQNAGVRTAGVAWSAKGEAFLQTFNPDYMLQHISELLQLVKGEKD